MSMQIGAISRRRRSTPSRRSTLVALIGLGVGGLMGAAAPVTQDDPPGFEPIYFYLDVSTETEASSPEALLKAFMDRHTSQDYAGAAEMAIRLIEVVGDRPEGYYNLACAQARLHRYEQALDSLESAITNGWRNLAHTLIDPDLIPIRDHARFKRLMNKTRRLVQAERVVPVPLRTDEWRQVVSDLELLTPSLLERYNVPGLSIALVNQGDLVWSSAFGVSSLKSSEPLKVEHGYKLSAPTHLLALLAALAEQERGGYSVRSLLAQGMEFDRQDPAARGRVVSARPTAYVLGRSRSDSRSRTAMKNAAYVDRWQTSVPEGWPAYRPRTTNFVLLQHMVEEASRQSFYSYCREHLFDPLLLESTKFMRPSEDGPQPVVGHTRLGTPIASAVDKHIRTPAIYTTAADMGRLLEGILSDEALGGGEGPSASSLDQALGAVASELGRLGLGVHIERTEFGPCVQLADNLGGVGCLIRWYPQARSGVVVMFNSETGPQAALRLATLALGGR